MEKEVILVYLSYQTAMTIDPLALYYLLLPILTYTVVRCYQMLPWFQLLPIVKIYCVTFIAHHCPLGHNVVYRYIASFIRHMQFVPV